MFTVDTLKELSSHSDAAGANDMISAWVAIFLFVLSQFAVRGLDVAKHIERLRQWERYALSIIDDAILAISAQAKLFKQFSEDFQLDTPPLFFEAGLGSLKAYFVVPENELLEQLQRFRTGDEKGKVEILSKIRTLFYGAAGDLERAELEHKKLTEEIVKMQMDCLHAIHSVAQFITSMIPMLIQLSKENRTYPFAGDCCKALEKYQVSIIGKRNALGARALGEELIEICVKYSSDLNTVSLTNLIADLRFKEDILTSFIEDTKSHFSQFASNFQTYSSFLNDYENRWKKLPPSKIQWIARPFLNR
jgi:hypothetical protein